jgi:hypothetical protein
MFVADAGIALWIAGLLLLGLLGFVVMVVALLFRFMGWVFRALIGGSAARHRSDQAPGRADRRMLCPHPGCGCTNGPTALYCGRCGRPLRRTYDVDAYG